MDFLKRHYEKVILLGLFVFFIGLMSLVQSVISQTREVRPEDLKLPPRTPDYTNIDQSNPDFNTEKLWEDSNLLWEKGNDGKRSDLNSDMVQVYKMAACPFCKEKNSKDAESNYTSIIPLAYFSDGKCPECQSDLQKPWDVDVDLKMEEFRIQDAEKIRKEEERKRLEEEKRREEEEKKRVEEEKKREEEETERQKRERDRDGDGLSNVTEEKYGMDSNDPFDLRYDNDGDGFSNIYELENGYLPNDAFDHPEFWKRLRVVKVELRELNHKFMAINDNASEDQRLWRLQFNHPHPKRKGWLATTYLRIGSRIEIEGVDYQVTKIERRFVERPRETASIDKNRKQEMEKVDVSVVIMKEVVTDGKSVPRELRFPLKQTAYSNDYRVVMEDTGNIRNNVARKITRREGGKIVLGLVATSEKQGEKSLSRQEMLAERKEYRVLKIDEKNNVVKIEEILPKDSQDKPRTFEITKKGVVPAKQTPTGKVQRSENMAEDVLRQENAVIADNAAEKEKKVEKVVKRNPNAPRKPLIGAPTEDGLRLSEHDMSNQDANADGGRLE